jgi:hypothetical protein
LRALSPKIVVVTEAEANHNAAAFWERFDEAVNYYALLFDCLERRRGWRGWCCGVVACEGAERKERHERLAQWARRMETGGMECVGLSYGVMMEARKLLQSRVRGHARRARRRVLLLLAPEAALLHLQIVDSSLTELDYWGLEKLKAILTSGWIWRRHSTQEHMD